MRIKITNNRRLIISALSIMLNLCLIIISLQAATDNYLNHKVEAVLDFSNCKNWSQQTIYDAFEKIELYSKNKGIEIAQYSYLGPEKIDIYTTMQDNYAGIKRLPHYIVSKSIETHNFNQICNVGFKGIIYVDTKNIAELNDLSELLSDDCELTINESTVTNYGYLARYKHLLLIYVIAYMSFSVFDLISKKREYFVRYIFGYSKFDIFITLCVDYYVINLASNLVGILLCCITVALCISKPLVVQTLLAYIIVVALQFLLLTCTLAFSYLIIYSRIGFNSQLYNNKMIYLMRALKLLTILFAVILISKLMHRIDGLSTLMGNYDKWNETQNYFNIYEIYPPSRLNDLTFEDKYNNKMKLVYDELSTSGKVFILNTNNFEHDSLQNTSMDNTYYKYLDNIKTESDIYSPYGNNIYIDKNYLAVNKIQTVSGHYAIEKLSEDSNALNILVPEKYSGKEQIIYTNYLDWFYFQKVVVPNIYNEAKGLKDEYSDINNLKVNIIYIKNGTKVFTYNPYSGDKDSMITDPIITVYSGNIDNSFLAYCYGSYIYFHSQNEYSALKELSNVTMKYNAFELNNVESVYERIGATINTYQIETNITIIEMLILLVTFVILTSIHIFIYYKTYSLIILIKILFGYHYLQILYKTIFANIVLELIVIFSGCAFAGNVGACVSFIAIVVISFELLIPYLFWEYYSNQKISNADKLV